MNAMDLQKETIDTSTRVERFNGLDAARATAMLLGVFYHLPIAFMGGGFFGGPPSPKSAIDNWLHSFRMPLFFLISGFFASMMLEKYGLARYFARRWWRIGTALFVSFLLIVGFRIGVEQFQLAQAKNKPSPGAGFSPGMGPMPSFGPPGMGGPPAAAPGATGTRGGPASGGTSPGAANGISAPTNGFGAPPPGPPMAFKFPGLPSRDWSNRFFGNYSKHLSLEHLWFLWYLLVMVSVGPFVAYACLGLGRLSRGRSMLSIGVSAARWNLLGVGIGLVGMPLLLHAKGFMGWSLANPYGFSGAFPDFLFQYYADWPHYAFYFAIGWWMFSDKSILVSLEKHWMWALAFGVICFSASQQMSSTYAVRPEFAQSGWVRWSGFLLYGIGAAYSVLGFLGLFERYMKHPSPTARYLADRALWIYLVHLPLIPYVIGWVEPWKATWWEGSIGGMILVTGICLALYELIVRPTPLKTIYGPSSPRPKPQ